MTPAVTEVSPLDHILLHVGKPSTTISNLPHQIEKTKRQPMPIAQNLELLRENGQLRQELAFYRERERSLVQLFHKCLGVQKELSEATKLFSEAACRHEDEMLTALEVTSLDIAGVGDFRVI